MSIESIKTQLPTVPQNSGVYQFFDDKNQVLYVGKAKNLYRRIQSYTKRENLSARIAHMVFLAQRFEFIQTKNEVEALLLEHNLIKKLSPKFNVLLRDDKTFPSIEITNHNFPKLIKNRDFGKFKNDQISRADSKIKLAKNKKIFGPFASALDVNNTIATLRKSFLLRNCSDTEFKLRKKPCLEYQIKRCSAPCVGLISQLEYQNSVNDAIGFLQGKSAQIQKSLTQKMQQFSASEEFEKAALARDQIKSLNAIQAKQNINVSGLGNCDVITIISENGLIYIQVSFYRFSQNYGTRSYLYEWDESKKPPEFLAEFLGQFYLNQTPPDLILLNIPIHEKKLIGDFLNKVSGQKIVINTPKQGIKATIVKEQQDLAKQQMEQKISQNLSNKKILREVKSIFNLPKIPNRIEVYDNSHTSGTNPVATLISAGPDGFIKGGYRKFNIGKNPELFQKHDDSAMVEEILTRRFSKLSKEDWPDLIIIDGGKPQLNAAKKVFNKLRISIPLIAMAKGENRNSGEEKFYQIDQAEKIVECACELSKHHPVRYYLQRLRDEAHRFAITTHRKKRNREFTTLQASS